MNQDTKPAPLNVGDHVRYVGSWRRELPGGRGNQPELVLVPDMTGVIVTSTGALTGQTPASAEPWRCRVQFQNGYQCDITPENCAEFQGLGSPIMPTA